MDADACVDVEVVVLVIDRVARRGRVAHSDRSILPLKMSSSTVGRAIGGELSRESLLLALSADPSSLSVMLALLLTSDSISTLFAWPLV